MDVNKLIVTSIDVIAIGLIYWFFLMKKDKEVIASDSIDIMVDGGYTPSTIVVKKGKTVRINFFRKDPSTCLEEVVIEAFKIRTYLPLNKKTTIEINVTKKGEFPFSCGMGMFHGKIISK